MSDFESDLTARLSLDAILSRSEPSAPLDETFTQLWSEKLSQALAAADVLYAPDNDAAFARQETEEKVVLHFWRLLMKIAPRMPESHSARYRAIVEIIHRVLRIVRETPTDDDVHEFYAVALRPIRRLELGALTEEVCAGLIDYHRGQWHPYLTRPQLYVIEFALARTVAALPPDSMGPFWQNLRSHDPMRRSAMLVGLRYLSAAHDVTHLLRGLKEIADHATRSAIVDHLEKIAEPSAIPTLMRLRRDTAASDWTLSRQIGRAIRVIEKQNAGVNYSMLLRPATTPPDQEQTLLRPMTANPPTDPAELLRSAEVSPPPSDNRDP